MITPSNEQNRAIQSVMTWYRSRNRKPFFYLAGFAGVGKTSVARFIADEIGGTILYAAFTGKAAQVLRSKGCDGASTIHSLIYKSHEDEQTGAVTFRLDPYSKVKNADLIIIDECSMVNEEMGQDLLSFKAPVLVLGDPAQLPPVKGEGFFTSGEPDYMLTEVHRQARDNPIIAMSMKVRDRQKLSMGRYGESLVTSVHGDELFDMDDFEQTICGMNKTRRALNELARNTRGFEGDFPVVGDRLVCLKNDRETGFLNGGLWDVAEIKKIYANAIKLKISSVDQEDGKLPKAFIHKSFFTGDEKNLDWRERKKYHEFDYGYALTAHKAQGSTFKTCCIIDESYVFREDRHKWLYTAITRASDRITVVID